jgi:hypothetical protein
MKIEKTEVTDPPAHANRFERIDTAGGPVVLCNPTRAQLRRWRTTAMKGIEGDMGTAYEQLFLDTCVTPGKAGVQALLDEWPGVCTSGDVIAAMNRLAGITNEEAGKA